MSGQIPTPIGSMAAVAMLLAWGAGVGVPTTVARADDCLTAPNSPAPAGSHWYYQTDRAKQRKCWFLLAKDLSTQQPAAQAASEAALATRPTAFEEPATASVGAPMSTSPADSPAPQTSAQPAGRAPGVGVGVPTTIARADDCLTAPNSPTPEGRRWFYRTDRATQRKCWYLRAPGEPTQRTDAQAPSAVAPKKTSAFENATASVDAPMVKSSAEGTRPLLSLTPQPAPMTSATTEEVVEQSVLKGSIPPSTPASQTSAQAARAAPAAATVSPDPLAGATASMRKPNEAASDARADSLRMTVDARLPDDTESTARGGASTANAAGMATSLTAVQMFLMGALGLGVASLLYRVVTAAARRRPISIDHLESDWIGDQNPQDWQGDQQQHRSFDERNQFTDDLQRSRISGANDRDDQQQHRSVDDRDPFIDDLGRSPLSGVNDYVLGTNNYGARRPYPADDERPNNVRRTGGASQKVSEREDNLAQLRRDLDWLLQSSKGA